jgi:hypothetical protein
MPQRRQIYDRQPSVSEAHETVDKKTFSIRSAMGDGIGHFTQVDRRYRFSIQVEYAADSAHNKKML